MTQKEIEAKLSVLNAEMAQQKENAAKKKNALTRRELMDINESINRRYYLRKAKLLSELNIIDNPDRKKKEELYKIKALLDKFFDEHKLQEWMITEISFDRKIACATFTIKMEVIPF